MGLPEGDGSRSDSKIIWTWTVSSKTFQVPYFFIRSATGAALLERRSPAISHCETFIWSNVLPHINTRQISNLILLPLFRGIERDVRSDDCAVLFFRVLKLTGPTLSYSILSLYFSSMCPVKYRGGTQIWNLLQMQAQRNWVVDSGCLHDHSRRKLRTRRASLHDGTKWQRLNCSCCLFQQGIDFLKHSKLNGHCTYQSVLSPVPPQPPLLQTWHLMS